MSIKRTFRVLSLLMSAGVIVAGCSGDDDEQAEVVIPGPPIDGSQGGSAGSGGSGGSGGSQSAGSAGSVDMGQGGSAAGTGGSAGSGGTQSAGEAGSGGCAFTMCDEACVDTQTSAANCGACGKACDAGPNQVPTCTSGVCGVVCMVGFADCDPSAPGCEMDVSVDVNNCGACGNTCADGAGVPAQCVSGMCQLACPQGKQDCNGDPSDGCESDKNTDADNCGTCGNTCPGSTCVEGGCVCAGTSEEAKLLPLDLYIIMDQSRSMEEPTSKSGKSKWAAVKEAISSFVQDPKSEGLGVGIKYFPTREKSLPVTCTSEAQCGSYGPCMPLSGCSNSKNDVTECIVDADCDVLGAGGKCIPLGVCSNNDEYACFPTLSGNCSGGLGSCVALDPFCQFETCSVGEYATPAVAISALPDNATNIITSLDAQVPLGGTPTKPALEGAVQYASGYAKANPRHTVVVLLATDGMPNDCSSTIDNVAQTALAASQQETKVRTFVIGVFGDSDIQSGAQTNLDKIAKAGGGQDTAFVISTSQDVAQEFLAALNNIRGSSLSCSYEVPKPQSGAFDPQMVNVLFTPGSGGTKTILYVDSLAGCSAQSGGWYYDDPANPTKIIACPSTCASFQQGGASKVEIQLGCATTKP